MNNFERITYQIEEVKRVMTPEVTEHIRLSTETLSQIGIENLEKLGQNQNDIENLISEITEAKQFLNETQDRIKYSSGPGLSWDDPVEITEGTVKGYNYNVEEVLKSSDNLRNKIKTQEEHRQQVTFRKITNFYYYYLKILTLFNLLSVNAYFVISRLQNRDIKIAQNNSLVTK